MKPLLAVLLLFFVSESKSQDSLIKTIEYAHKLANSNPDSALIIYDQIIDQTHPDSLIHIQAYTGKGNAFYFKSEYDSSLSWRLKALKLSEEKGFTREAASNRNNLGSFYMTLGKLQKASEYLDQAYINFTNLKDTVWLTRVIINQAGVDFMSGRTDPSLEKLKTAAHLCKLTGNVQSEGGTYTNISIVYRSLGKVDSALTYVDKGIELLEEQGDQRAIVLSLKEKGNLLLQFNRLEDAKQEFLKMNKKASEMDYKVGVMESYNLLAQTEKTQNNYQSAFQNLENAMRWKDSVLTERNVEVVGELEAKYESDKKDSEIELLSKENALQESEKNTYIAMSAGILSITLLVLVLFIQKQRVNKVLSEKNSMISKSLAERELLLKEIHHRVKNNLQIVSSLLNVQSRFLPDAESKKAIQEGRNRVQSMALVHQKLYQNEDLAKIEIPEYLGQLSETLFDSYNIDEERIQLNTNIESVQLDLDTTIYLGLMVNELVSNALKYAFPDSMEGKIEVSLKKNNDSIQLQVSDNGVGSSALSNESGYGTRLIQTLSRGLKATVETLQKDGTTISVTFRNHEPIIANS